MTEPVKQGIRGDDFSKTPQEMGKKVPGDMRISSRNLRKQNQALGLEGIWKNGEISPEGFNDMRFSDFESV